MTRRRKGSWLAICTALLLAVIWGCQRPPEQAAVNEQAADTQVNEADKNSPAASRTGRESERLRDQSDLAADIPASDGEEADDGGDVVTAEASLGYEGAMHAPPTPQMPAHRAEYRADFSRNAAAAGPATPAALGIPGGDIRGFNGDRLAEPGEGQFGENAGEGIGPGQGGDQHDFVPENPFVPVAASAMSTFSIDVDTASFSNARMYVMQHGQLPQPQAVRIEEFINYFNYQYEDPTDEHPFSTAVEVATCPWQPAHRLVRVGLQGERVDFERRAQANLVFLLDVSGSMNQTNKLPLVKDAIRLLVGELNGDDRVAIVVYAGAAGLVLDSTELVNGQAVLDALEQLQAGGSTNGGAGIQLAYQVARDNYIPEGINRVILCTDGDFNVGQTSTGGLVETAAAEAKDGIFLSVLGFGSGNYNDAMLESISNNANGNCAFIDTELEARKVMVEQVAGTLITIAKDVKIQVEFNPTHVYAYRLIGYENRMLQTEDFADDKKDAGEIGAGHQVTALYEIVPVGAEDTVDLTEPGELRYQTVEPVEEGERGEELLTVALRYKLPEEDTSTLLEVPVVDNGQSFGEASEDFRFATCVAAYGMLLKNSQYAGQTNYDELRAAIRSSLGNDSHGYRAEFLHLVGVAQAIGPVIVLGDDAPESGWEATITDDEDSAEAPVEEATEETPAGEIPTTSG